MRAWMSALVLVLGLLVSGPGVAAGANYQGLWWNPQEGGWGINFAHQGDIVFATWFTYDAAGKPWWLIAVLARSADGVYAGPVSTVAGPLFNSAPFGPAPVETEVGTMTATFADASHATLQYTVNGVTQTKAIVPQQFGPLPTCVWGGQPNLALATNYQDLWWNPQESGWGVNFTHQGDTIFATWFTYDAQGKPWWLIAVLARAADGFYSGPVSTVAGPAFNSVPWGAVAETEIGSATVSFADGNHASFAYTVNDTTDSRMITRQVFVPPGTVCTSPSVPTATAVGEPTDSATSATIGAAGGSVAAPDGKLVVIIPAGALAADTVIGVQPLTNMAHGKVGAAYRLTPNGQTFAKPVTLKFSYTDQDLAGTAAEFLGGAFQTADGYWQWLGAATVDAVAKTASVASSHFTDLSAVANLQLMPAEKVVKVRRSVSLKFVACYDTNAELAPLGYACITNPSIAPATGTVVSQWAVNGNPGGGGAFGTVSGAGVAALYTAPDNEPLPNTVAVSARIDRGAKGTALAVSNITITEDMWTGSGSSLSTGGEYTFNAKVTWVLKSRDANNVALYAALGKATLGKAGCSIYPSTNDVDPRGFLFVDFNANPPTYHGAGATFWTARQACEGGTEINYSSAPVGGSYLGSFLVPGEASGVVTNDGTTIEHGESVSGAATSWLFTREP